MIFRIAGFGGQGIMSFGHILGRAAVMEGRNAIQTQSYGSAARGGAARSDICISDDVPYELNMEVCDVLVAMSQPGLDRYLSCLKPGGLLIYEKALVTPPRMPEGTRSMAVNALESVSIGFGTERPANLVLLGFTAAITGAAGLDALETAVKEAFAGHDSDNIEAMQLGYDMGSKNKEECA